MVFEVFRVSSDSLESLTYSIGTNYNNDILRSLFQETLKAKIERYPIKFRYIALSQYILLAKNWQRITVVSIIVASQKEMI